MSTKTEQASESNSAPVKPRKKVIYRPDLDGLRGIAIAFVVIFHVWMGRVSGGVDVFLALSGFFFLGSLVRGATTPGSSLSPLRTLWRLVRRLYPVLIVVVAATVGLTMWLRPEATWTDVLTQAQATLLYYQNWELALTSQDYAAADASISPLQHLWSMSVQGQFYLIALALVLGIAALFRVVGKTPSKWLYAVLFAAICAVSIWHADRGFELNQPWNYYDTWARLWELFIGGVLAIVFVGFAVPWILRTLATIAGLTMIVTCGLLIEGVEHFPAWWAWYPVGGALLIVVFGMVPEGKKVRWYTEPIPWLLSTRPMRRLGDLGYSLYLIHWPLLIFYLALSDSPNATWMSGTAIILVSLALAWLAERYIERPLRMKSRVNRSKKPSDAAPATNADSASVASGTDTDAAEADSTSGESDDSGESSDASEFESKSGSKSKSKDDASADVDSDADSSSAADSDSKSATKKQSAAVAALAAAAGAVAAAKSKTKKSAPVTADVDSPGDDADHAAKDSGTPGDKSDTADAGSEAENKAHEPAANTETAAKKESAAAPTKRSSKDKFALVGALSAVILCGVFVAGMQSYWTVTADDRASVPEVDPLSDSQFPGARAFLEDVEAEGDEYHPTPLQVGNDLPASTWDGCISDFNTEDVVSCVYGDPDADRTIALVGGSHSEHWITAFDEIGRDRGFKVVTILKMGCPLTLDGTIADDNEAMYAGCVDWTRGALETIVGLDPEFVATTATRPSGRSTPDFTPYQYIDLWKFFSEHGIKTLAIRDTPWIDHGEGPLRAGECLGESGSDPESCGMPRDASLAPDNPAILATAGMEDVRLLDFTDGLCGPVYCPAAIGNVIVYHDSHHMSSTFVRSLRNEFEAQLSSATGWW